MARLVKGLTANRNRAVADVRRIFNRMVGNMGEAGCVAWLFEPKGYITIPVNDQDPEHLFDMAVEAGADDVVIGEDIVEIFTTPDDFQWVREWLQKRKVELETADLSMIPKSLTPLGTKETLQVMGVIEALEDLDDVQQVYSNLDVSDEAMAQYEAVA